MAATATLLELLDAGSHIIAMHDLYGGSYRLFENVRKRSAGHSVSFVDLSKTAALEAAMRPDTRLLWVESPTNPLLKLVDLAAVARDGARARPARRAATTPSRRPSSSGRSSTASTSSCTPRPST